MRLRSRVGKLRRLPWRDRALLVEATFWLGVARAAVLLVPFRRLSRHLGEAMTETPAVAPDAGTWPDRVAWAIRAASRATPWRTPCLAEAIAGQRMLMRRRVPSTIYLGLNKNGDAMAAHAWLRCGGDVILGEAVMKGFAPVASFAQHVGEPTSPR